MHYYKFNIADWALHTAHLDLVEEAIYFRLVNFYYDSEAPIPLDIQPVIRRLRMGNEAAIVEDILNEFFEETEKGFTHKRCEEILKVYKQTAKKNKANGSKGGRPSKTKGSKETQKKPSGLVVGTQMEPNHNPNQELITSNQEPVTTNYNLSNKVTDQSEIDLVDYGYCFDQFWESGIRKVNKKKTYPIFIKLLKKLCDPFNLTVYDFTGNLCKDVEARINANQLGFAEMHPTTYLNGERWTDEIKEAKNENRPANQRNRISTSEQHTIRARESYQQTLREIAELEAEEANENGLANLG